jgi:hypothetical protein
MYLYNQFCLFYSARVSVFSSTLAVRFIPPASFTPLCVDELGLSLAYSVTVLTCGVLSSRSLLFILPLALWNQNINVKVIMKRSKVVRL